MVGSTNSSDFPVYNPGGGAYFQGNNSGYYFGDAFILKFNSNCVRLWATYYWGSNGAYAYSVTTDPQGNVYVVGSTVSLDFPVYDPGGGAYFQGNNAGVWDIFIVKFESNRPYLIAPADNSFLIQLTYTLFGTITKLTVINLRFKSQIPPLSTMLYFMRLMRIQPSIFPLWKAYITGVLEP